MDYQSDLLEAINNYCDFDDDSKNRLRDLVCIVSENEELKRDIFIKELLYIAANKMRVFGYNTQNQLKGDPSENVNDLILLRNEAVKTYYKSNVWDNNLLDKAQKEIVDLFSSLEVKRLLVSAPTSYGKTYLMREILYINKERYNNVLLIFPTVALLKENMKEMNDFVANKELEYIVINTVSAPIDSTAKHIFVLTPERALQLLALYPELEIDFLFFDEIYKIDEDYCNYDEIDEETDPKKKKSILDEARAKAFRIVLYLLSKEVKDYYLAGPHLDKNNFGKGMLKYLSSNHITVKEIKFEPTLRIGVEAWGSKIQENYPMLPPSTTALATKKQESIDGILSYITSKQYGQTILYCTTPAKASEYSRNLSKIYSLDKSRPERLKMFISHIKDKYNIDDSAAEWSLVKVLERGFAMHHGKLPRYVQNEILSMFNQRVFDILFCTSTIIEGVNTKAKNIVLLNSTKGRAPLTPFDIKNIKGRAGRYYHNFIGRVFYTDKKQKELEDEFKIVLDFATYGEEVISSVDLDNAEMHDLSAGNASLKSNRLEIQKSYLITDGVFTKNRLIPKDVQEKILQLLLDDEPLINTFIPLINSKHEIRKLFLDGYLLNKVLNLFVRAGILDELRANVYNAIAYSYYKNGFIGILEFQIRRARENNTSIDQAYANAFNNLKNIIEHRIPKILSLFEALFVFVGTKKGYDMEGFTLSSVTRFYETGVYTDFGEFLVEYGFPTDTIRLLEAKLKNLIDKPLAEAVGSCKSNLIQFLSLLDSYEKILFQEAIQSYR